ncbi:glycoside hydrolase family 12 protein [Serpula lacrymans var. lacrymans S7.3]|uniref:Glycoside hydrolase family 12 protein n=2 Tax=Serpula lacrymans var. lacrymans TaxID=341189 RepID=F8QB31_SERL3|nr:glycoside hydrolase family 12 protein [Serpula lacrymans var. lacrymans S7.9]EGN94417.1 glycoside hydrolase family 12 protein [Serpula lacrymans var. lacrymans S7.3]EGO19898.1 glycoside hydrolase family 12 protein [Serpula lacrymans var. lacrymans S7.9]
MLSLSALVLLLPLVSSALVLNERRTTVDTSVICGQYDSVTAGQYSLNTDLWGESDATSGSQCSQLVSLSGTTVAWTTNWTWTGGSSVKSFSDIQLDDGINQQLSAISSMPTTWDWSQASTGTVVGDVAYDLFTSDTSGGSNVNEIMIWLANYNSGPISADYNSSGDAVPVATGIALGGYTWDLYSGSNGANNVFSYLPSSGTIQSFSTDIYPFLTYLVDNEGVSTSQYLTTAQAGTEATTGTATLTTSAYSLSIN